MKNKLKRHKNKIYTCAVAVLAVLLLFQLGVLGQNVYRSTAKEITDWGLSFQKEGEVPIGNASSDYLAQYNAYYVDTRGEKTIYLTFDAGYENGYTEKILDILKENDVKAAFFLVSHYMKENPELIKRMVNEGHLVCNHTMHHPDMTKMADFNAFSKELTDLEGVFQEITGAQLAKFYRPPSGKFNESNLKFADQLGYKTIFWSLAYADWLEDKQPTPQSAFDKLLPRMHPGAIVLLHSTSRTNSEILDEFIKKLQTDGYTFKTLNDLK